MQRDILIAVSGGILSAVASMTIVLGLPGALLFAYLAPLPLIMVGLALGLRMATIAAAAGFVVAGLIGSTFNAGLYGLIHAVPGVLVVRYALSLEAQADGTSKSASPGLVLSWLSILAAGLFTAAVMTAFEAETGIEDEIYGKLSQVFAVMVPNLDEGQRTIIVSSLAAIFPGALGTSWIIMIAANATLAQRLVTKLGKNLRPTPSYRGLTLPDWISWFVVGSASLALVGSGDLEYMGCNLVMIMATPFFFVGLAIIHSV
ncbi:MAG: DUF2232 domain-containing protein, partial [Rhodospirillales bacterium]